MNQKLKNRMIVIYILIHLFCFSLTKNYKERPKYRKLLDHKFLKMAEISNVDVAEWFGKTVPDADSNLTGNSPVRRL